MAEVTIPAVIRAYLLQWYTDAQLDKLQCALARPPLSTVVRVNTLRTTVSEAKAMVQAYIDQTYAAYNWPLQSVLTATTDALTIAGTGPHTAAQPAQLEVIVDTACGQSVLRGAHVFVPGILACGPMEKGDRVAVYVDVDGKCLFGSLDKFTGRKLFVGNGIARISRAGRFCQGADNSAATGVGIEMTEPLYRAPCLGGVMTRLLVLQNLSSVLVGHALNPRPGERVLDMCAAPGGKTTHLAALMNNEGTIVAFDKSKSKVAKLRRLTELTGASCIKAYKQDCSKIDHARFLPHSFDRVLLDPPCSGMGQRPWFVWEPELTLDNIRACPSYQRLLVSKAVEMLRPGGTLVYSTCTLHPGENEEVVGWALRQFKHLRLVGAVTEKENVCFQPGMTIKEKKVPALHGNYQSNTEMDAVYLTDAEAQLVARFDPTVSDSIGFFIAKFVTDN